VRLSRGTHQPLLLLRRVSHHRFPRHSLLSPNGSINDGVIVAESRRTRPVPPFARRWSLAPSRPFSSAVQDDDAADSMLEETYSRKTPLEHILLRPAMYIGSTERLPPVPCWVLRGDLPSPEKINDDPTTGIPWAMQREELSLVPALLKVFDEILVNASDNHVRHPGSCDRIDVVIHRGGDSSSSMRPYISIANNGRSIPVQVHRKENMYVPELLFGHLLTGSNFKDDQRTLTGGRHGYGAKLTNVFSREFVVEIRDGARGKTRTYKQVWEDNMHICHEAEIDVDANKSMQQIYGEDSDYTKISFVPDLARLTNDPNTTILPEEEYKLMRRRVVDIAGCSGGKLAVTLNGEPIHVSGFDEYVNLFRRQPSLEESTVETSSLPPPMVYYRLNSRWEVAVGLSETRSLESMSFVNRMQTSRGGTHVDIMARQISQFIADHINSKISHDMDTLVTARAVRRHLSIFVNCLVENPSFDSQMKECLTSNPENFGCNYTLPSSFMRKLVKPLRIFDKKDNADSDSDFKDDEKSSDKLGGPGIVEDILDYMMGARQVKDDKLLKEVGAPGRQTKRQVLAIPKLDDANLAGGKRSANCTLILTEGDSAKALAVAGLEIIGRDNYGVFPLRGKFLNVRSVSVDQLAKNAELKSICTILGLQFEKSYETWEERNELRYGHIMLMTDQDADGSHIKGLIINLFRHFWPALLRPPIDNQKSEKIVGRSFLSMFVTPLLKATKRGTKKESLSFFSMAEYNAWRDLQNDGNIHQWKVKYYKGLGTSTSAEAKDYFLDFVQHHRPFRWQSEANDGGRIDMAFEKDRADDRKNWILTTYNENSMLNVNANDGNSVTYGDFVDKELIHFSNANNIRAFPSVVDGLKPSQRKVLYACFKRNLKDEIKVAQLAGFCAEHTAYHHGEASLHSTIVGMAQNFVGSNNINLVSMMLLLCKLSFSTHKRNLTFVLSF
jgi:DNA topoisomerase-2